MFLLSLHVDAVVFGVVGAPVGCCMYVCMWHTQLASMQQRPTHERKFVAQRKGLDKKAKTTNKRNS
jgi:hypothetical protein